MIPKFRAFWLKEKIMTNIYAIYFLEGGIKVEDGCCYSEFVKDGNFVLMQSTGLHDKNGVEIFEGDIVNINTTFRNPMTGSGTLTLNKNFEVIFVNGMFTIEGSSMGISKDLKYLTVVGDVYKNHELLEDV